MLFLPYDHFTIQTGAPPQEARDRLAAQVRKPTWSALWQRKAGPPYEGAVAETTFKIQRIIRYRNSFLPVVVGAIRPTLLGSDIEITMRMQAPVIGFMVVWFGVLGVIVASTYSSGAQNGELGPDCAGGLFLFAIGYGMTTIAFQYEAAKARTFLEEVFMGLGPAPAPPNITEPAAPAPTPPRATRPWVGGAPEALKYGRHASEDEDLSSSQR